jgi:hypothetical protein
MDNETAEPKIGADDLVRALLLDRYGTVDPESLAAAGASNGEIIAARSLAHLGVATAPEPPGMGPLIEGDRYLRRRPRRD